MTRVWGHRTKVLAGWFLDHPHMNQLPNVSLSPYLLLLLCSEGTD
jgi:hypothetical protein